MKRFETQQFPAMIKGIPAMRQTSGDMVRNYGTVTHMIIIQHKFCVRQYSNFHAIRGCVA